MSKREYICGPKFRGAEDDPRIEGDPLPEAASWKGHVLDACIRAKHVAVIYVDESDDDVDVQRRSKRKRS